MIKKISFLALSIFLFFIFTDIYAQTEINPIEVIMEESGGAITIDIPNNIVNSIIKNTTAAKSNNGNLKPGINKLNGFRIQVFSDGRNPATLESRARARGNTILSRFPQYKGQVYTFSSSPNWYTRIGNFKTAAEANAALTELKKAFPNFAPEMRVVKSQIFIMKQ